MSGVLATGDQDDLLDLIASGAHGMARSGGDRSGWAGAGQNQRSGDRRPASGLAPYLPTGTFPVSPSRGRRGLGKPGHPVRQPGHRYGLAAGKQDP